MSSSSQEPSAPGKTCCIVTGERSKCKAYSSWVKERLDVKFVLRNRVPPGKPAGTVFIRKRRTGKTNPRVLFFRKRWPRPKVGRSLLEGKKDLLNQAKIWTYETGTSSLHLSILLSVSHSGNACAQKMGTTRRNQPRIHWNSTRTSSSTRRTYLW